MCGASIKSIKSKKKYVNHNSVYSVLQNLNHISGQAKQLKSAIVSCRFDNDATSGFVHNTLIGRFIKLILNYGRDNCVCFRGIIEKFH